MQIFKIFQLQKKIPKVLIKIVTYKYHIIRNQFCNNIIQLKKTD